MATSSRRRSDAPAGPPLRAGPKPGAPLAAYVLHRWDWSETSLVVELFTRERGRVVVVAKGAKRPTSNFRAVLLPFHPLQALLGKTPADEQAEIHALRGAEWLGGQPLMPPAQLMSGFYCNELLMKLLARDDAHPALWDFYAATLATLALAGEDAAVQAAALRAFELALLRETGVLPELSQDTLTAEPLDAGRRYTLQAQTGLTAGAEGLPSATWLALEAALATGSQPQLLAACAAAGPALRPPLREVLHYHLGAVPLRTRQVGQGVQQLAGRRPSVSA